MQASYPGLMGGDDAAMDAARAADGVSDRRRRGVCHRMRQAIRVEPPDVIDLPFLGADLSPEDRRDEDRYIEDPLPAGADDRVLADQLAQLDVEVRLFLRFADRGLFDAFTRLVSSARQPPATLLVVLVDEQHPALIIRDDDGCRLASHNCFQ